MSELSGRRVHPSTPTLGHKDNGWISDIWRRMEESILDLDITGSFLGLPNSLILTSGIAPQTGCIGLDNEDDHSCYSVKCFHSQIRHLDLPNFVRTRVGFLLTRRMQISRSPPLLIFHKGHLGFNEWGVAGELEKEMIIDNKRPSRKYDRNWSN